MDEVRVYLKTLLKVNEVIVVAVSGGPDSMALLHLLEEFRDLKLKLIVLHVNHNLREEAIFEAQYVERYCKENNLIYEYREIKNYDNGNIESVARQRRYLFLEEVALNYKANYIMTAHHGDDLVETILMRLVRGSSIRGYTGFKREMMRHSFKIVRPFITLTKEHILEYMDSNNFKYFLDKSNFSKDYTRNRYRMDILPVLKRENPNVHLKFQKFSQELADMNDFVNNYIETLDGIRDSKGFKVNKLREVDDFILKRIILKQLDEVYGDYILFLNDKHTYGIINLIRNNKSNGVVNLPKDYVAQKDYNYFRIVKNRKELTFKKELVKDKVVVPTGVIKKIEESASNSNYVIRLNSKDITLPLVVRNRLLGDKMQVKNLNGSKKVKDILIDSKVSIDKRKVFPVVLDSKGVIIWLPGVKKSKFDVETDGIYDIILSYEEDFNEY